MSCLWMPWLKIYIWLKKLRTTIEPENSYKLRDTQVEIQISRFVFRVSCFRNKSGELPADLFLYWGMDEPTDGRTDTPSCRDARTHKKNGNYEIFLKTFTPGGILPSTRESNHEPVNWIQAWFDYWSKRNWMSPHFRILSLCMYKTDSFAHP